MDWMMNTLAWAAQTAPKTSGGADQAQQPFNPMIIMIVVIVIFFYVLILRPQKKEQRKREEMLNQVAKGDSVLTSGGVYGTVESVDKEKGILTLNVAPKVSMKFSRASVSGVVKKKKEGSGETTEGGE